MANHRMPGQPRVGGQLHNAFPPTGRYGGPSAADNNARRDAQQQAQQQARQVPPTGDADQQK
jgi:hypothetical protein